MLDWLGEYGRPDRRVISRKQIERGEEPLEVFVYH